MRPRHLLPFLAATLLFCNGPSAQLAQRPYRASDWYDAWIHDVSRTELHSLQLLGVDIQSRKGDEVLAYVTDEIRADLEARGFSLSALPKLGTRSDRYGYHTISEIATELATIEANYPSICKLHNIGSSYQGRDMWFMQISDNVLVEENEPEFKYISSMHGDEVVGMELCLELINLLTSQYGADPQITNLVDEVEIWIMPLMNPDGYFDSSRYNAQGVDLNRDFPDRVIDPVNDPAGRAVETQLIMNWQFAHSPVLSGNFHGGALVVNYPYDSDPDYWATYSATPDDALIIDQSLTYSTLNTPMYNSYWFPQGITNGVEWYLIYGGMQDWNYVWMGCNDVTIELDDDKWPAYSRIAQLWADNQASMLAYMELCLTGVRGLVSDSISGAPLAASVQAVGIDHLVYTDPDVGDYHRLLLPGTYSLEISAPGYVTEFVPLISVGAGPATVVDVTLDPVAPVDPVPDIRINGQDGPLSVPSTQIVNMKVFLDPGDYAGVAHDWWVFGTDGSQTIWWTFPNSWWSTPTFCWWGGLFWLPGLKVARGTVPVGTWTFTFAVDARDGV